MAQALLTETILLNKLFNNVLFHIKFFRITNNQNI
jgi:hypothetical protein